MVVNHPLGIRTYGNTDVGGCVVYSMTPETRLWRCRCHVIVWAVAELHQLNAQKITRKLQLIENRANMEIEDLRAHSIREVLKAKTMERRLAEDIRAWDEHKKT